MAFIPEDKESIKMLIDCKSDDSMCIPIYIYSGGKRYTLPEINHITVVSSNTTIGFGTKYTSSGITKHISSGITREQPFPFTEFNKYLSIDDIIIDELDKYMEATNYITWSFQITDYVEECEDPDMQTLMDEMLKYSEEIIKIISANIHKKRMESIKKYNETTALEIKSIVDIDDSDESNDDDDSLNM